MWLMLFISRYFDVVNAGLLSPARVSSINQTPTKAPLLCFVPWLQHNNIITPAVAQFLTVPSTNYENHGLVT